MIIIIIAVIVVVVIIMDNVDRIIAGADDDAVIACLSHYCRRWWWCCCCSIPCYRSIPMNMNTNHRFPAGAGGDAVPADLLILKCKLIYININTQIIFYRRRWWRCCAGCSSRIPRCYCNI